MAGNEPGYWDYIKSAFNLRWRMPLLGRMPANKLLLLAFLVLAIANPGFLMLGLAFEAAYLLFLSNNARFRNLVKGERLSQLTREQSGLEQDLVARLELEDQQRYQHLVQRCRNLMHGDDDVTGSEAFAELKAEGINQLLLIYLKMLTLKSRIAQSISRTRREELETDTNSLKARLARETEGTPVYKTLQGTMQIQKTRLENFNKNLERIKFAEAELDRIEKQVSLIAEEVTVGKNAEQWSGILDSVMQSIQGTTQWMAENSEISESVDFPSTPVNLLQPKNSTATSTAAKPVAAQSPPKVPAVEKQK